MRSSSSNFSTSERERHARRFQLQPMQKQEKHSLLEGRIVVTPAGEGVTRRKHEGDSGSW